jgi:hypothetical protein
MTPVERLAIDFLSRVGDGEQLAPDAFAAQLQDEGDRRQLVALIEDALRVQSLMPSQVRPGMLLKRRYRLLREIGSGGMGRVFEAEDGQLERRVAVKVLTTIRAESFDPEQFFAQEALLLAKLQHPNIVVVHEFGNEGDTTFIVMDLVEGAAVSDVLERVASGLADREAGPPRQGRLLNEAIELPLPAGRASLIDGDSWFRTAARIVLDVTRTIEEAHGKGVIHRDIKPHNILLRGDGSPVILDFGLAGTLDLAQGAVARGLFGTAAYLAPEQATTSRVGADRRTDVYQLGLLLYEFLTLRRAFPGDDVSGLLSRISHGQFERPRAIDRGIPFELEAICLKAMELDPARRYETATALREDLQRYVEGSGLPLAARGGVLAAGARTARYWVRRHKPLTAVALTLAAALLSILIVVWSAPVPPAVVTAYRYRENASPKDRVLFAPAFDTVRPGDVLGVRVNADEPQWVYVLSAFGARHPPTFVAPMVTRELVLDGSSAAARPDPAAAGGGELEWGRRVAPGVTVNCTEIQPSSAAGSYEGLWIFTSKTKRADLEVWMRRLSEQARQAPEQAVPLERAMSMLDEAPLTSRGGIVQMTDAQLAREAEALDAAALVGDVDWPFRDLDRTEVFFRVER